MKIKSRFGIIAGAILVMGALLTGAAFAKGGGIPAAEQVQKLVESGKLTQGEADVLTKLSVLRKSFMEKLQAESKAITDQGVTEGKITQEQADRLLKMGGRHSHGKGGFFGRGHGPNRMNLEELKAGIEAKVQAGKITREQADEMLKHWEERSSKTK